MRIILTLFSLLLCYSVQAQKNTLLEQSFWQNSPDVNVLKAEISKGNDPSELNAMSMDPVVMAINAQVPFASIEYLLLQPGNQVDKLTHDSRTYLHWAASRGNVELVEYLLKKGAKTTVQDSHGASPLTFAAGSGQQDTRIYELLIAHGADLKKELSPEGANVLLLAIANDKDFKLTDYFISKGLSLNSTDASGNNAFAYAARAGNIDVLKALIQKGIKPDQNAMLMAAQAGSARRGAGSAAGLPFYQYLEHLNIKPATTSKTGENVLHYLVRKPGQNDIIQYFLSKNVDVNQADEEGNTVFMNAASVNRDTVVLGMLLPGLKNINHANQKGITALAMAVRNNAPEVVGYLLGKGADVKVTDKGGNSLSYYLIESYRPVVAMGNGGQAGRPLNGPKPEDFGTKMELLQKAGLSLNAPQENGNTLYHLAVAKNDISLFKLLQPLGIDINSKNKEGLTALHKAALISKDDAMLKYLISTGAKKDAVTNFKETAYDLASENESLTKNNVSVNFLK